MFLARGPQLKRPVVIKRILASMLSDADMLRAFLDETRIAARLRHPNIVRIDELGEVEGEWFVRMEYVEGASLSEVLKRAAKSGEYLPLEAVLSIGAGLASALDYAHHACDSEGRELQIVHRDVTPQNVLLARSGDVKLIDFGVARAEQRFLRTMPGLVKGKLPYMSPEQADGRRLDARSDIFALGVCLWEALTGRRLFRGASQAETMQRLFACQVSPPSLYRPEVPAEVDALVLKALSREVSGRFKRAADLGEAIETVVEQYALPSGAKAIAALTRALVPDAGHAEGLSPDEEPTGTLEGGTDAVTRQERPGGPRPKWAPESALTMVVEEELVPEPEDGQVPSDEQALIGRAAELADLHQLIGSGERLVTLLGPGGVGKSRLAREAARQQVSTFRGRVWVADLTAAKSVEGLCLTVSESIGVALPAGAPVEAVGVLLAARRDCLVVLDNVEQLSGEVGAVVLAWLAAAKGAHFLLCSRVALGVEQEKKYEVGPLPIDGTESDAMRLFLERVRALNPHFPTGRWAQEMVKDLVRRLDGMPLAIELAAAQMADAPLESLRETARLRTSAGGSGQFLAIDQAFEASWAQLSDEERAALAQCTVFVSGFAAGAALDVLRLPGHPGDAHREAVLQVLHRLRSKSLLRVSFPLKSDQARYGMYESIRARVINRLPQEEVRAQKRHASWYLRLGETLGPAAEKGAAVLDLLTAERDNLVSAWEWWLRQPGDGPKQALRVLLALDALFLVRGPYGAHLSMLDAALEKLTDPADRAPGLEARARVLLSRGRLKEAAADLDAVLSAEARPRRRGPRAGVLRLGAEAGGLAVRGAVALRAGADAAQADEGRAHAGPRLRQPRRGGAGAGPAGRRAGSLRGGAQAAPARAGPALRRRHLEQPGRAATGARRVGRGGAELHGGHRGAPRAGEPAQRGHRGDEPGGPRAGPRRQRARDGPLPPRGGRAPGGGQPALRGHLPAQPGAADDGAVDARARGRGARRGPGPVPRGGGQAARGADPGGARGPARAAGRAEGRGRGLPRGQGPAGGEGPRVLLGGRRVPGAAGPRREAAGGRVSAHRGGGRPGSAGFAGRALRARPYGSAGAPGVERKLISLSPMGERVGERGDASDAHFRVRERSRSGGMPGEPGSERSGELAEAKRPRKSGFASSP